MKSHLTLIVFLFFVSALNAQITIGSANNPKPGSLLDLKMDDNLGVNSTKGLLLPRVELKNIRTQTDLGRTMGATTDNTLDPIEHAGLVVYNTGKLETSEEERFCPGIHVWDGEKWFPLVPYSDIKTRKTLVPNSYKRSFEYLDPNDTSIGHWPADKIENAAERYALGKSSTNGTGNIVDNRPNDTQQTYTVSRFYVGNKVEEEQYTIEKSFLCNPDATPNWIYAETVSETSRTFDEGVWMTQNLRAMKMPDGTSLTKNTSSSNPNLSAHIYYLPNNTSSVNSTYGVLYNWAAAIGVGKPYGPSALPANKNEGGSTTKDVSYQGICPEGWYLPSDQEWTDLSNGIVNNVSMFSGVAQSSVSSVSYDSGLDEPVGGYLGRAMKSSTQVTGKSTSTNGQSKSYNANGFDAYLVGSSGSAAQVFVYEYGDAAYFWTSSRRHSTAIDYPLGFIRQLKRGSNNLYRSYHDAEQTFSVRCKKITE